MSHQRSDVPQNGYGLNDHSTSQQDNPGQTSKPLPLPSHADEDEEVFVHQFSRDEVRELIHVITQEIKVKGTKTVHVFLSFRPKVTNEDLTEFLARVFPTGAKPAPLKVIEKAVAATDELVLIAALKYLWSRLPGGCVVGWESYESFKKLETKNNHPKKAFLEFMPQCLTSPSHSSIVYDFLELLVSLGGDSKSNQLSGRKIAKMAGIWAFQGSPPLSLSLTETEPMHSQANSFTDGLNDWIPAASAMFHLLLSFLRSMLPDDANTKLHLPRALQALLASNAYPPPDVTFSSSTLVHIPLVTIRTNSLSKSPIELINKVPKYLKFEDQSLFEAKEDYALLKSLCRNDDNILNKLSGESRRILEVLCSKEHPSNLNPGWVKAHQKNIYGPLQVDVSVTRVSIDDYFIWAWLASISFEQTAKKKSIFGRSIISEVVFDGFKKWIIIEEQNINLNIRNSKAPSQDNAVIKTMHQPMYTSMLDGLPDPSPTTRLKKPKPVENFDKPLPAPVPQRVESDSKAKSLLNTFKKLNHSHQHHKKEQHHIPVQSQRPVVPKKDSFKLEPVESLPVIETEQYRLSIPLDGLWFGEDAGFDDYDYQQQEQNHHAHNGQYTYNHQQTYNDNQHYYQPNNQEESYSHTHYKSQKPADNFNNKQQQSSYQAMLPSEHTVAEHYPNLRPEPVRHSNEYAIKKAVENYGDPDFIPSKSEGLLTGQLNNHNTVNGLSNMVDQIKIHVSDVEKSLEGSRPQSKAYEVDVPLPKQNGRNDYRTEVHQKVEQDLYGNNYDEAVQPLKPHTNSSPVQQSLPQPTLSAQYGSPVAQNATNTHYQTTIPTETYKEEVPEPLEPPQRKVVPQHRKPHASNTSIGSIPSDLSSALQSATSSSYGPVPNVPNDSSRASTPTAREPTAVQEKQQYNNGFKSMISEVEQPSPTKTVEPTTRTPSPVRNSMHTLQATYDEKDKRTSTYYDDRRLSDYPGTDFIDTYRAPSMYFAKGTAQFEYEGENTPELPRDVNEVKEETKSTDYQTTGFREKPWPIPKQNVPHTYLNGSDSISPNKYDSSNQERVSQSPKRYDDRINNYHNPSPEVVHKAPAPVINDVLSRSPAAYAGQIPDQNEPYSQVYPSPPQQPQSQHQLSPQPKVSSHPGDVQYQQKQQQQLPPQLSPRRQPQPQQQQPQSPLNQQKPRQPQPPSNQQFLQTPSNQISPTDSIAPLDARYSPNGQFQRSPKPLGAAAPPASQSPFRDQASPGPKIVVEGRTDLSPTGKTGAPIQESNVRYLPPGQPHSRNPMSPNTSMTSETSLYRGSGSPRGHPNSEISSNGTSYSTPTNGSTLSLPNAGGPPRRQSPQYPPNPNQLSQANRGRSPQNGYPPAPHGHYPQQKSPNPTYPPPSQYPPAPSYPPQGYPPPQGYYPPAPGYPSQGYPPQGYPPQGYPPQGYPPQGYSPQSHPPQGYPPQGYYPPPSPGQQPYRPPGKPSTAGDFAIGNQPSALGKNKLHHNTNKNKKDLRNALTQGDFGI